MFNVRDIVLYKPELPHVVYEGKILSRTSESSFLVRWYKRVGDPTYCGPDLDMLERHLLIKEPFDISKEAEWE